MRRTSRKGLLAKGTGRTGYRLEGLGVQRMRLREEIARDVTFKEERMEVKTRRKVEDKY
jgi:hypothetical protein